MVRYGATGDLEDGIREAILESLRPEERFLGGIRGADAVRSKRQTRLILTDTRLIAAKQTRSGIEIRSVDRNDITGIGYKSGILNSDLEISSRDGFSESWSLQNDGADAFVKALQQRDSYTVFVGEGNRPVLPSQMGQQASADTNQASHERRSSSGHPRSKTTDEEYPTNRLENLSPSALASRLQGMDNYEFEQFVGDLWTQMGWETEVSQASVDAGVDVIATKETPYRQKKVIQAKRYSENTTVGGPDIQQYASLKTQVEGADSVVIVTTSSFTPAAEERANELNVKLVDEITLTTMVNDLDAYDLVAEYLDLPSQDTVSSVANTDGYNHSGNQQHTDVSSETSSPDLNSEGRSVVEVESEASLEEESGNRSQTNGEPTAVANGQPEIGTRASRRTEEFGRWHYGIIGGTGLALLASIAGSSSLLGLMILLLPILVYIDARAVSSRYGGWTPRKWLYASASIFFFIGPPIYLYKRWKNVGV